MNPFELGLLMLVHPSDAFDEIKLKDKRLSALPGTVILLLVLLLRYGYTLTVHAPLADIRIQDTNILLECGRILLPVLTLVISIYAVESILYGETKLKMIYTTVTYCMIPFLIITPVQIGLSQIMSLEDGGLYGVIGIVMWIWIVLLVFVSIMYMNNFSLKKAVLISLLSIIFTVIIWGIAIMAVAMTIQFAGFIGEMYREYILFNL